MFRRAEGLNSHTQCPDRIVKNLQSISLMESFQTIFHKWHLALMRRKIGGSSRSLVRLLREKFLMNGWWDGRKHWVEKAFWFADCEKTAAKELATRHWHNYTCKWNRFFTSIPGYLRQGKLRNFPVPKRCLWIRLQTTWKFGNVNNFLPTSGSEASPSKVRLWFPKKHCGIFLVCSFVIIVCKSHRQGCFSVLILSSSVTET